MFLLSRTTFLGKRERENEIIVVDDDEEEIILPIFSPIFDQLIDADLTRRLAGVRAFFAFSCVHSWHSRS